jgi:hypothetical protein
VLARSLDWLARPTALQRLGVMFCVLVALVAAIVRYPSAIREANDTVAHNAALDYGDREIAGGNSVVADQAAMYEARSRIPAGATYRVVTGEKQPSFSDLTIPFVAEFARSFLLPRRPSPTGPWVLCYGCDGSRFPNGEVVWKDDEGVSIIRLPQ